MSDTPKHAAQPTQTRYPWRAVARTAFQGGVSLAAMAPLIYSAANHHEPEAATGFVGGALVISAGITRVMALPGVNDWLRRFVPFLAADKG